MYVKLDSITREALQQLAQRELRRSQDQAVKLIVEGLRRRGLLQAEAEDGQAALVDRANLGGGT